MWSNGFQLAGAGASFPEKPADNDVFFRTDEGKLYHFNGSIWVSLTAKPASELPTSISFPQVASAGDAPEYARADHVHGASDLNAPGWTEVTSVTVSNDAVVDLSFTGGFDDYRVEIFTLRPVTDSEMLHARVFRSGAIQDDAGDYLWHNIGASASLIGTRSGITGDNRIYLTPNDTSWHIGNASSEGIRHGVIEIDDVNSSSLKQIRANLLIGFDVGTLGQSQTMGWLEDSTGAITGIRLFMSSGNLNTGTLKLYGRSRA